VQPSHLAHSPDEPGAAPELIDVRQAANRVGRHPETVRRWIWSGRLAAKRDGRRLLVAQKDVDALVGVRGGASDGLAAWAERALAVLRSTDARGRGASAADLVLGDRAARSGAAEPGVAGP